MKLSIPKPLKFGIDKQFHPTEHNGCNYLSMLGLKLPHVSKRGTREVSQYYILGDAN